MRVWRGVIPFESVKDDELCREHESAPGGGQGTEGDRGSNKTTLIHTRLWVCELTKLVLFHDLLRIQSCRVLKTMLRAPMPRDLRSGFTISGRNQWAQHG